MDDFVFYSQNYILLVLVICANGHTDDLVITIPQGRLKGTVKYNLNGEAFYSFQGIPYAKPPVGKLRFKTPESAEPWNGTLDATKEGSWCYQYNIVLFNQHTGDEDCLYLNVYTTVVGSPQLKPVMVFIHGGGFNVGSGGLYGPEWLLIEDIVFVTFNYRLNIFGFLSFDEPIVEVPGNAGLKDQVLALQWVQNNIKYFSGDPSRVTIFGNSAGSASVHLMVLSPRAKGLFHNAIMMSGVADCPWVFTDRKYKKIAKILQFNGNVSNQQEIFTFLLTKSSRELLTAQLALHKHEETFIGELTKIGVVIEDPQVENAFIVEQPRVIMKSGNFNQVPMLMGITRDEGYIFSTSFGKPRPPVAFNDIEELVPRYFHLTKGSKERQLIGRKLKEFYYGDLIPSMETLRNFINITTDIGFAFDVITTAKLLLAKNKQRLYFYHFAYITKLNYLSKLLQSPFPIACHDDDIGYLFPLEWRNLDLEPNSSEITAIRRAVEIVTNFAKYGNPNSVNNKTLLNVEWPVAVTEDFQYLIIEEKLRVGSKLLSDRMSFWYELKKNNSLYFE